MLSNDVQTKQVSVIFDLPRLYMLQFSAFIFAVHEHMCICSRLELTSFLRICRRTAHSGQFWQKSATL